MLYGCGPENPLPSSALVVGNTTVDVRLVTSPNALHEVDVNGVHGLFIPAGEKLVTRLETNLGGNAANVAIGLQRLGVATTLYTYTAQHCDSTGLMERALRREGVTLIEDSDTSLEGQNPLGIVLPVGNDRTIFSGKPDRLYGFEPDKILPVEAIYLTSIGSPWQEAYKSVVGHAKQSGIPIALSPGSSQLKEMGDTLVDTLKASSMLFVNLEEAKRIVEEFGKSTDDVAELLLRLQKLGPQCVSITDGVQGSYALGDNGTIYRLSPLSTETFVDTTGAGDAYASAFMAGFLHGHSVTECMKRGAINAYSVMKEVGAQKGLLYKEQIDTLAAGFVELNPTQFFVPSTYPTCSEPVQNPPYNQPSVLVV